jgi:hypothetical protein
MHLDAFGTHLKFPRSFTYLRPSSSRAGTPQRCLSKSAAQPLLVEQVGSRDRPHCRWCSEARPLITATGVSLRPVDLC